MPATALRLDDDARATLRGSPALLRAAAEFNAMPARYVHPDRLPGLGFDDPALFARLAATERGARRLSRLLLRRAGLGTGDYGFADRRLRLALLPGEALARVFRLAAAASLREPVAKVIERDARQRLRKALGDEAWLFAVKQAAMTLGPLCRDLWTTAADGDLPERFAKARVACLQDCFAGAPAELAGRLALKLGDDWPADFTRASDEARQRHAAELALRIVKTEVENGGGPCFA